MTARLVASLYTEAMLLADETRSYFDEAGREDRDLLPPLQRVLFSCESLKVTTRLMHVVAWLLTRRAVESGEMSLAQARAPGRKLGPAAESDPGSVEVLPPVAQDLIEASCDLYARVARLEQEIDQPSPKASPARSLLSRLENAF
ncbi:regulator of CtrA degradation [Sphingomonas jatrophae]|uniref:Regulator of CtrA degradation n=2 Tax=Sphingomonas jatrophae TaxID=1166337 RepID=A0A1I6JI72_9SPHN|nr:regulator of CtrA degradation [Sphingomonas jatrophae]